MRGIKLRKLVIVAVLFMLVGSMYFYYFSKPKYFLTENELIEIISKQFNDLQSVEIQEVIYVNDYHVFVPFKSSDKYGTSYWVWKKRNWQLGAVSTIQQPFMWQVDPKDASTHMVVWNMDPEQAVSKFDVYMLNKRGYSVINQIQHYTPKIQLHFTVQTDAEGKSYGIKSLPNEWASFLDTYAQVENSKTPSANPLFAQFKQPRNISFGWNTYDDNGEVSYPKFPNGSGRGYGRIDLLHMNMLSENDLE